MQFYRDNTLRVNWSNYASGLFFVTICTHDKIKYFGRIENNVMLLSDVGQILDMQIKATPLLRQDMSIDVVDYVIMPNHVHLLIHIGVHDESGQTINDFDAQRKNLASVIRGIKCAVTSECNARCLTFRWQPRYYEEIIRVREKCENVIRYIDSNVINWGDDEYH